MTDHPMNRKAAEEMRRRRPNDKWPGDEGYVALTNCCGAPVDKDTGRCSKCRD